MARSGKPVRVYIEPYIAHSQAHGSTTVVHDSRIQASAFFSNDITMNERGAGTHRHYRHVQDRQSRWPVEHEHALASQAQNPPYKPSPFKCSKVR